MTRRRALGLFAVLGLLAAGLALALWTPSPGPPPPGPPPGPADAPGAGELGEAWRAGAAGDSADAGRVTLRVSVLDEREAPVAGAVVEVLPLAQPFVALMDKCDECRLPLSHCQAPGTAEALARAVRSRRAEAPPLATGRTADDGGVALSFHSRGDLWVRARDGRGNTGGQHLEIRGASALTEREATIWLGPPRSLAGHVVGDDGQPVAGASVLVIAPDEPAQAEVTSDALGRFQVACPDELCELWVIALAEGFLPLIQKIEDEVDLVMQEELEAQVRPGPAEPAPPEEVGALQIDTSRPRELTLSLTRGAELEVLTLLEGRPVDAELSLLLGQHSLRARASGGAARVAGLRRGHLTLEATAQGLSSGKRAVDLRTGYARVELLLRPVARAVVEVVAAQGGPVPLTQVTLQSAELKAEGKLDAEGSPLALEPVPTGHYTLRATSPEGVVGTLEVDLAPGDNPLTVRLPRALFLRGRVLDAQGGPAGREWVTARSGEARRAMWSSADGGFFAIPVDHEGPWDLEAQIAHSGAARLSARAPADGLLLRPDRKAGIRVRVSAGGSPVPQVVVEVRRRSASEEAAGPRAAPRDLTRTAFIAALGGLTDDRGEVEIWGLEPGPVSATVRDGAFRPAARATTLVRDQLVTLELALERGATLSGRVVDERGAGVGDAEVAVTLQRQDASEELVPVAPSGSFTIGGLEPGSPYELVAANLRGSSAKVVARPPATGLTLTLKARALLRGRVVTESGTPIREFSVDGTSFKTADGRFEAEVLGPGESPHAYVTAEGFEGRIVDPQGAADVGDVVLMKALVITGKVLEPGGRPARGARIDCRLCPPAVTGAQGEFEVTLSDRADTTTVRASLGAWSGFAEASGQGAVLIQLAGPTRIEGRSYDLEGRPLPGKVTATSGWPGPGSRVELTADASGRFTAELPSGDWHFKSARFTRRLRVEPGAQEVVLGTAPNTCSLAVNAASPSGHFPIWLGPAGELETEGPGDLMGSIGRGTDLAAGESYFTGLPCGRYTLWVFGRNRFDVELRGGLTRFALPSAR